MMSPLVTLNRSSCVIIHRRSPNASDPGAGLPDQKGKSRFSLGGPLHRATGFAYRRSRLVARHDFVDAIEVLGVVLALGLRLADKGRCHQLMIALAVIDLVRLQLDVIG